MGRRFIQSSTDILVGWTTVHSIDFYVGQFRDMKVIPSSEQVTPWLRLFARMCGLVPLAFSRRCRWRALTPLGSQTAEKVSLGLDVLGRYSEILVHLARSHVRG